MGKTRTMLHKCVDLIDEVTKEMPVLVRAHTSQYAFDLAHQFAGLARLRGWTDVEVSKRSSPLVCIEGRAVFQFCSYERSAWLRGKSFREVFDDNSIQECLGVIPEYD